MDREEPRWRFRKDWEEALVAKSMGHGSMEAVSYVVGIGTEGRVSNN